MNNNLVIPKQIFLIGGGKSATEGIEKGLWSKLENKFTLGLNFCFKIFPPTFTCFVDPINFYKTYNDDIKNLPLLVGRYATDISNIKYPNTIFLKHSEGYSRNLSNGVYHAYLCGLWALSLAIYLINEGEIFLLGYDGGCLPPKKDTLFYNLTVGRNNLNIEVEDVTDTQDLIKNTATLLKNVSKLFRPVSHWYQGKIEHKGVGKIKFYHESNKVNKMFEIYKNEQQCKIYNVSPQSNIVAFSKITYDEMFQKMDNQNFNQDELRQWIKEKLELLPIYIK